MLLVTALSALDESFLFRQEIRGSEFLAGAKVLQQELRKGESTMVASSKQELLMLLTMFDRVLLSRAFWRRG